MVATPLRRSQAAAESPLRAELYSADQMERHGEALALAHRLRPGRTRDLLLRRLTENEGVLVAAGELLKTALTAGRAIAPAGEWLLDNFHLIEEQVRTAKRHLPKAYSRELPRLLHGPSQGLPRAYDIALEAIAHGDGRLDAESLRRFVAAYQTLAPLKLGELWAVPIMLRLALLENLRRVAARIAAGTAERDLAGAWADRMIEIAGRDAKSLILSTADMARSNPPITSSFVAELARRLQGQGAALALPLTWIEQRLSELDLTIEQLVQSQTREQAADQVSMANSIGSLRLLGATDWREFVEAMSVVERSLREDRVYGAMDFATRDRYRHAVEKIAKASPLSEGDVAREAMRLAHAAAAHVGFYLIDKGVPELERAAQARVSLLDAACRTSRRMALPLYLGAIALLTGIFSAGLVLSYAGGAREWMLVLIGLVSALAASQLAVALVNRLATALASPEPLPRIDFSGGIAQQSRTLVVVPAMLTSASDIERLVEALEVRFLANRDDNLHYALLTDFQDADEEKLPADEALALAAFQGIDALNRKYRSSERFFLFHRPRRWNSGERRWMGYERKRGKLSQLNSCLRDGRTDRFSLVAGETKVLRGVRYVITLDTDTQLPRDAARQLAGAMAHPLNRYGILQPRMAVSLPAAGQSRYAQLFGAEPGIDPYTRAVSDVYQDLFGEGSFIGKGIYDVDAFERSLEGRFPENRILSHDLLEGCYARAGLLSDVELYEEYPSRYGADVSRRHRWIRGDWQIAGWLLRRVPGAGADRGGASHHRKTQPNPLSWLSQWKIFDNLRRSLAPLALVALMFAGWSLAVLAIVLTPALLASFMETLRKPVDVPWRRHLAAASRSSARHMAQAAFTLACLPYEAFFSLDAILRTAGRMLFTRTRLLEWKASSELDGEPSYRAMWIGPATAIAAAFWLAVAMPVALAVAAPVLLLWLASPAIAWWVSRPLGRRDSRLTADQTAFLRTAARKTWSFFETFVGPEDHWLPPDNFQEHPVAVVAHRTSPTNMGLALLANLSAYDFGYLTAGALIERIDNALATMRSLDRHQGHFYNWYDTRSLKPLPPLYVSSVDSGNLACHLLTLRPGLLALADDSILAPRCFEGLRDAAALAADAGLQADVEAACESPPATVRAARLVLERFVLQTKAEPLARQCQAALDELAYFRLPDDGAIPTLRELAGLNNESGRRARERIGALERLARECGELARMEYGFLVDKSRQLLAIGYNVAEHRR
ncbi:MAG TPA: glycosyltransferase family 2 protein, partial [Burkholderiales bacterium]|nr:glycosyltransferase family 2 protein [Burkholderiales bacterium]